MAQTLFDMEIDDRVAATSLASALGCGLEGQANVTKWRLFFNNGALRDVLDSHTVIVERLRSKGYHQKASGWIRFVEQVFREENLCYTINELGEVHFAQDAEFQANRMSTVSGLGAARYRAVLEHFQAGHHALSATPPKTREAIRQTFEAVETLFKLIYPDVSVLGATEVERKLRPPLQGRHEGTEKAALNGLISAFKSWVVSCQGYRHGQGTEETDNPSVPTAVLSVSTGASFLRWLAEVDAKAVAETNQTTTGD